MKEVTMQLAQYKSLTQWSPQIGDFIVQHGWFTHWFGIINGINNGVLTITKAGLPLLLFTMDEIEISKNLIQVPISKITRSRGGKFAVLQTAGTNNVWYV